MDEDSTGDQLKEHKELEALFEQSIQINDKLREYKKLKALFEQSKQVDPEVLRTKEWNVFFKFKSKKIEGGFSYSGKTKERKNLKKWGLLIVFLTLVTYYLKYCHK